MAKRLTLAEELRDADLETAQRVCKKKARSLNLDKLVAAARAASDSETKVWLARRAFVTPPSRNPEFTRLHSVLISGSMEDLEVTLDEGEDWFLGPWALTHALQNGFDDIVTRVLDEMPDSEHARRTVSHVLLNAIRATKRPLHPQLVAVAPLTHDVVRVAALYGASELFGRGLDAGCVSARVLGSLVVCARRYVDAVLARPDLLALHQEDPSVWSYMAMAIDERQNPPLSGHPRSVEFLAENLELLIRGGLCVNADAALRFLCGLTPGGHPNRFELIPVFFELMMRVGGADLNASVRVGSEWSMSEGKNVDVYGTLFEAALYDMPLALCQRLHALGLRPQGHVHPSPSWSERKDKCAWLESLGSMRSSTAIEAFAEPLAHDIDYDELAALFLVGSQGFAGVEIGMHESEVEALGYEVSNGRVTIEVIPEGYDGAQVFCVGFEDGVVARIEYELLTTRSARVNEARDAFAAECTAAHGKSRGSQNMTWRFGRTKCVLTAKPTKRMGWELYQMRMTLSAL